MNDNVRNIEIFLEEILKISFEKAKNGDVDFAKINELAYNIKKNLSSLKKVE
jgi:hypothetical protein